jgi:hypothetical protein
MIATTSPLRRLPLLAAAVVVAATLTLGSDRPAQSEEAPAAASRDADERPYVQPPATIVAASQATFADQFALLRQPGGEEIPATTHISDAALDVGDSRLLTPPPARRQTGGDADFEPPEAVVFVTPRADGSQCLLAVVEGYHGPSQTCSFAHQAVDGYFLMTTSEDNVTSEIYGLMPDGVEEVTVLLADGDSATLPVVENGYMARFDQPTQEISWIDPEGVEQSLLATSGA